MYVNVMGTFVQYYSHCRRRDIFGLRRHFGHAYQMGNAIGEALNESSKYNSVYLCSLYELQHDRVRLKQQPISGTHCVLVDNICNGVIVIHNVELQKQFIVSVLSGEHKIYISAYTYRSIWTQK